MQFVLVFLQDYNIYYFRNKFIVYIFWNWISIFIFLCNKLVTFDVTASWDFIYFLFVFQGLKSIYIRYQERCIREFYVVLRLKFYDFAPYSEICFIFIYVQNSNTCVVVNTEFLNSTYLSDFHTMKLLHSTIFISFNLLCVRPSNMRYISSHRISEFHVFFRCYTLSLLYRVSFLEVGIGWEACIYQILILWSCCIQYYLFRLIYCVRNDHTCVIVVRALRNYGFSIKISVSRFFFWKWEKCRRRYLSFYGPEVLIYKS